METRGHQGCGLGSRIIFKNNLKDGTRIKERLGREGARVVFIYLFIFRERGVGEGRRGVGRSGCGVEFGVMGSGARRRKRRGVELGGKEGRRVESCVRGRHNKGGAGKLVDLVRRGGRFVYFFFV